ncbi:MAG TPA: C2H2-type zinc finger protein [Candidatus Angelobacter sp.]|nr:C2H2-type zinc finger protein [Candidatus Angelobacter sp.]
MPETTKTFSCSECTAQFKTQQELDGHKKSAHGQVGKQQQPPQKKTA